MIIDMIMYFQSQFAKCSFADRMDCPMEQMEQGYIKTNMKNGQPYGGVTLLPGLSGNALYVNGYSQWVNFGDHSASCVGNPDYCSAGFTYLLWFKLGSNKRKKDMFIFSNGAPSYPGTALSFSWPDTLEIQVSFTIKMIKAQLGVVMPQYVVLNTLNVEK